MPGARSLGEVLNWRGQINHDSPQAVGLKGWWPTNGPQEILALRDRSGFGNHATTSVYPTAAYSPVMGRCRQYDGTNDTWKAPSISTPTGVTVMCWAEMASYTGATAGLVCKESVNNEWLIFLENGLFYFRVAGIGTSVGAAPSDGAHLFAGSVLRPGAGGRTSYAYIDGVDAGSVFGGADFPNGTGVNDIGSIGIPGVYDFSGRIGDVRIYDIAHPQRVIAHAALPQTRWDLYWVNRRSAPKKVAAASTPGTITSMLSLMGVG
jgi:hypothetical protein